MVSPLRSPSYVVMAYDATKDRGVHELRINVDGVRKRGDILRPGDTLIVLGVLHRVPNPMGYQIKACPDSFAGASVRAIEEEVVKKVDVYVSMLLQSAEACDNDGVSIEVKITAGTPIKQVIFQEVVAMGATWLVLDRHLTRDMRVYEKQIPCKVALVQDNLSLQIVKNHTTEADSLKPKLFYSMAKPVPLMHAGSEIDRQSVISCRSFSLSSISIDCSLNRMSRENSFSRDVGSTSKQDRSCSFKKGEIRSSASKKNPSRQRSSEAPILCSGCGARTELYMQDSMRFTFLEIQLATDDFSQENLLGEGGYGHVYKGELQDGQLIAAKVRKEASSQGFAEFHSEVYVLNFARHKNIVMLLGFCCKKNRNILVYEYICNKSLHWHLFDKSADVLQWRRRHAIAIGTAKGLRFLHEECRAGPIIHRDLRPSNILLTHDFVPMVHVLNAFILITNGDKPHDKVIDNIHMYRKVLPKQLGDFGLAKWKTGGDDTLHTRILGTLGYLAPEYAEDGVISVRTDVYAFGIVLLQLISGRKVIDSKREQGQSIRQWAEPLLEKSALHELIDPRIAESYDPYELYLMAKTANLCVQKSPELRPSMGEVVRLLEGEKEKTSDPEEKLAPNCVS